MQTESPRSPLAKRRVSRFDEESEPLCINSMRSKERRRKFKTKHGACRFVALVRHTPLPPTSVYPCACHAGSAKERRYMVTLSHAGTSMTQRQGGPASESSSPDSGCVQDKNKPRGSCRIFAISDVHTSASCGARKSLGCCTMLTQAALKLDCRGSHLEELAKCANSQVEREV